MKPLTIILPDRIFELASDEAREHEVEVGSLCAGILGEYFLGRKPTASTLQPQLPAPTVAEKGFNVAKEFAGFPSFSISLAQRFVDEALQFPGVRAFRNKRGIGFEPNFVFIEYVMSRARPGGIGVSFYGEPDRHTNPPSILANGIPSYSRAKAYSESDLEKILPHVRQSFELKFGKQGSLS